MTDTASLILFALMLASGQALFKSVGLVLTQVGG